MQQLSSGDTEKRSGKRQSIGKRKLSDQGEPSQPRSQTISELLSERHTPEPTHQQSHKRSRLSSSPNLPANPAAASHKMYPNPGVLANNGAPFGRGASGPSGSAAGSSASSSNARQNNFTPHTGARKLVVKNLRTEPRLDQDSYFDKMWFQFDAALTAIFDGKAPDSSLEELYKGGENICRQDKADLLARKLQRRCKDFVNGKMRQSLIARAKGSTDIDTLRAVMEEWSSWKSKLVRKPNALSRSRLLFKVILTANHFLPQTTVRWIFYYLEQSFLLNSKEYPVIRDFGLIQFRSHIFTDANLKPKILKGAYYLIAADRANDTHAVSSSALFREVMDLFHTLDVYASDFEPVFISESKKFIVAWAEQQAAGTLATYVENTHQLIEREIERCELFAFNQSTKHRLSEILDETLIMNRRGLLTNNADVVGLLRVGNKTVLKQLVSLLKRRGLVLELKPAFKNYIIQEGESILFDQAKGVEMVVDLLQFKKKVDDIWVDSLGSNEDLGIALREAFDTFMNRGKKMESTGGTDNPRSGEMIAKYVDKLLKGGYKMPSGSTPEDISLVANDAELDRQLDQVLDLFRFVQGKAVFEAFYKNDLSRRLLMKRSASNDAEKSMLARLKNGLLNSICSWWALYLTSDQNAVQASLTTSNACSMTSRPLLRKW